MEKSISTYIRKIQKEHKTHLIHNSNNDIHTMQKDRKKDRHTARHNTNIQTETNTYTQK